MSVRSGGGGGEEGAISTETTKQMQKQLREEQRMSYRTEKVLAGLWGASRQRFWGGGGCYSRVSPTKSTSAQERRGTKKKLKTGIRMGPSKRGNRALGRWGGENKRGAIYGFLRRPLLRNMKVKAEKKKEKNTHPTHKPPFLLGNHLKTVRLGVEG